MLVESTYQVLLLCGASAIKYSNNEIDKLQCPSMEFTLLSYVEAI